MFAIVLAITLAGLLAAALAWSDGEARAGTNPPREEIRAKLYEAAVSRNIPPEILYGIAYQESTWRQFDSSGNPLIGYDGIGIGIMQISSYGSYDIERLKHDIDYNIAAGAEILLEKWSWVPSIGDDAMNCYENWFYAVWAYNGWIPGNSYPYTVYAHIADGRGWWPGVPVSTPNPALYVDGNGNPLLGMPIPTPQPAHFWTPPLETFFSWYDGVNSSNWVLVANGTDAEGPVAAGIAIAGIARDISPFTISGQSPGVVPPGKTLTASFPGQMGGPVVVGTSRDTLISQRILFGNSIEEVIGVPEAHLSSHYYWPWYDMYSTGYKNWILIGNPNEEDIFYRITLAGQERGSGWLQSGQIFTPTLNGEIGGPLEVESWYDEAGTAPAPAIASQRVLSNNGTAFNEAKGIPAESLSSEYIWPWYDGIGGRNWVLLANHNANPVDYVIEIGSGGCDSGPPPGTACQTGTLAAAGDAGGGDIITPEFPGVRTGPVRVTTTGGDIIASQRVIFGPSFGETPGFPASSLANEYDWTWYDQLSPGMKNWVLVANPGAGTITYTVRVGGAIPPGYQDRPLGPGQMETPVFPGWMGGPVEVITSGPAIASQRVLFNGYFNEVTGTVLGATDA